MDNEGINHIISVVDEIDTRPVWVLSWGGSNTLGGAVMKVMEERSEAEAQAFVSKIRGYEIAVQDDGHAFIAHHFPDAKLISSQLQWKGMSKITPQFGAWSESWGGNNEIFTHEWIKDNVQTNHGALGALYPIAVYLWEGDTPSFLYLLNNGLGSPENPEFGSWGGRFGKVKKKNIISGTGSSEVDPELKNHEGYYLISDAADLWEYNNESYENNIYAPVFRWREAYQRDFQARIDWCVKSYEDANHAPVPVFKGEKELTADGNSKIELSALGSSDPDGDSLSYKWIYYGEAGNFEDTVNIQNDDSLRAVLTTPLVYIPTTLHIILEVTDNGSPALTRYQRILVHVTESPPPPEPQDPGDLVVLSQSAESVELTWSDNSDNERGFYIERQNYPSDTFYLIDSVKKNITHYSDTSVFALSTYVYRVAAYNYGGISKYTNEFDATTGNMGEPAWSFAAFDNGTLIFEFEMEVRYGTRGQFVTIISTDILGCDQTSFGKDPIPGESKHCDIREIIPAGDENKIMADNLRVKVYPNPLINGQINIELDKRASGIVLLYDISGKVVLTHNFINQHSIQFDSNPKKGTYLLYLKTEEHEYWERIINK